MTVCTASLLVWQYSADDWGPGIIAASDRKLSDTGLGIGYEASRFKGALFVPRKQFALVSGDLTVHSTIIRRLQGELENRLTTTRETAEIAGRLLSEYRMQEASRKYLGPLGLDEKSFVDRQRTMEPSLIVELTNQLQSHEIDAEIMVAGCDQPNTADLFQIDSSGLVTCHTDIGFLSIGSGGIHSSAYFMITPYNHNTAYYHALYHTFVAKKRAEVDPFVGTYTDMFTVNRNALVQIPREVIDSLETIYAGSLERERRLPYEAEQKLIEVHERYWGHPAQPSEPPVEVALTNKSGDIVDIP